MVGHAIDTEGDGGEDGDPEGALDGGAVVGVCLDDLGQDGLEGDGVKDSRSGGF